jgi:hypothetical protein
MMHRPSTQKGLGTTGILILFIIFIGIGGAFYWLVLRQADAPMTMTTNEEDFVSDTDSQVVQYQAPIVLPGRPAGLAWDGDGFVSANSDSDMGFLRVSRDSNNVTQTTLVPVVDPKTGNSMGFPGIAWNGTNFVSMAARRSRLAGREEIFTLHDPNDLSIVKEYVAPQGVGCIVWDGSQYWAGTHVELGTVKETGVLYQLDKDFKVLAQYDMPMKGCRGIAWDGYRLLWADDLSNSLHLISLSSSTPEVVHAYQTAATGLSGVAYDGNNIWIAESGRKEIRKLDPRLQQQWLIGDYSIKGASQLASLGAAEAEAVEGSEEANLTRPLTRGSLTKAKVDEIVDSLIDTQGAVRTRELLKYALARILDEKVRSQVQARFDGLKDYGGFSYKDDRVLGPEDIQFSYLNVSVENGQLIGSWEVVAGDTIVEGLDAPIPKHISNPLHPAMSYTIHVESSNLDEPVTHKFEMSESSDSQDGYVLLEGLDTGAYTVRATMKAEYYVDGKGHTFTSSVDPNIVRYRAN